MSRSISRDRLNDIIWKKTGGVCAHCGKRTNGVNKTVDHVVPRALGGTFDQRNLMPLCRSCNRNRGSNEINVREFYPYASKSAINGCLAYILQFKSEHTSMAELDECV